MASMETKPECLLDLSNGMRNAVDKMERMIDFLNFVQKNGGSMSTADLQNLVLALEDNSDELNRVLARNRNFLESLTLV